MSHEGPHYKKFVFPYDRIHCGYGNNQDLVQDAEGKTVGISMVTVVWGDAADEKKAVKATVARFPYLDLPSNPKYPVEEIPRYQG